MLIQSLKPSAAPLRWAIGITVFAAICASALPVMAQPMGDRMAAQGQPGMHHGGPGMPHGMGRGMGREGEGWMHLSPRALDLVKATPQQRQQIATIMEGAHKDLQALRESGRGLRDEGMKLFAQPNVDAAAIEALRQKRMAHRDQASRRMTQAMVDASRVLTPEQRQQLADNLHKRRQMMERHFQERRSLDAPKT